MPDPKTTGSTLLERANETGGRRRLGEPEPPDERAIDLMSDDELKQRLRERGLEVRKARRPKGVVAREDNVRGKLRIGVHLPRELRLAIKRASGETNKPESTIAAEAFTMWMEANNLRT